MRIEERTTNCYTFIEDHKSSANIDTLLVAPEQNSTAKLDTYDSSNLKLTGTATSMKLVKNGEKVNAVIEGTVSGATGYLGDLLTVSIGGITANVVTNGDKFTATADVTDLGVGTYTALVANATVKDITDLAAGDAYWMHYAAGSDLTCTASEDTVTMNGKIYSFKNTVFSWGNRDLLNVDPVPAE